MFFDLAFVQKDQLVGHLAGKAHFVGDHHHGAAFLGQGLHDAQHFGHQLWVQGAGGFVKKHHLGFDRQCAGDGHTLLLAAAQVRGVAVFHAHQVHALQVAAGGLHGLLAADAQDMHRRLDDVLQDRHVRP